MKKRDIPLELLKIVEPFIEESKALIFAKKETTYHYELWDAHPESNFYFLIGKRESRANKFHYQVQILPFKLNAVDALVTWVQPENITNLLNRWLNIIREYNSQKSIYDDPIFEKYRREFYEKYKIEDEDADYAPFNLEQQFLLDEYFDSITQGMDDFINDTNATKIEEIKNETLQLKNSFTGLTKNQVMSQLTSIWAKMQKTSLPLIKKFMKIFAETVTKNLIDFGIKYFLEKP